MRALSTRTPSRPAESLRRPSPPSRPTWVDAAPFRAHLRRVLAAADVPWPAVAVAAGIPVATVHTLLFGRAGRPQARIDPRVAARVLRVEPRDLRLLGLVRVDAWATVERLRAALAAGLDPLQLARWCRIPPDELAALVDGESATCSRLTQAMSLAVRRLGAVAPGDRAA